MRDVENVPTLADSGALAGETVQSTGSAVE
jgi:hypothetical protein